MMFRFILCLSCLFAISSLNARIEHRIDEATPLSVTFSHEAHNRISVEDSLIEKIFGDASLFDITLDRSTGQAFINLKRPIEDKPSTLTVITSGGYIQDLLITTKDNTSEHLLLRESQEEIEQLPQNFHSFTIDILNTILEGKSPLGYGKRPLATSDSLDLPAPLQAIPLKAYEGALETIVAYRIINKGHRPITIRASSLKNEAQNWVFVNANELGFREQALCLVGKPKGGER